MNFSIWPCRAYEHYNHFMDYGKMSAGPTKLYSDPFVTNKGSKGPGSVAPKSSTVIERDETQPHRSKGGKKDKDKIKEDSQWPIFERMGWVVG